MVQKLFFKGNIRWPSWIYANYEVCPKLSFCIQVKFNLRPSIRVKNQTKSSWGKTFLGCSTVHMVSNRLTSGGHLEFDLKLTLFWKINIRNGFSIPKNLLKDILHVILKLVGKKLFFKASVWRPFWIYANYEVCPKLPLWQPSWIWSRTPLEFKTAKKVHRKRHF